ncbi:MAG: nucleoside permease [Calditrichaeota bacterium]|nr:nucleoside permease [Calditrichota bacterium]
MNLKTYLRLSVMMFLEFFVWGAWFVTLGTYLNAIDFSGTQVGYTYLMNNIAAIVSPFFIGMIADRYFNSEKVMAVLHVLGGIVLYFVSNLTAAGPLILGLLIYNLLYMPTIALANTISFTQMQDQKAQFPKVRVWGTIGWIVAGLIITFIQFNFYKEVEASAVPMKMAAIASILLGLYSFTLPNTPPRNIGKDVSVGDILGVKALKLMKERSFLVFVIASFLISIPLAFYYNFTNMFLNGLGMTGVAAKQSMGQMSEVIFMLLMPYFFKRLGVKAMMLIGMFSWVLRYVLFANGDLGAFIWMLYLGILLHGVCYDFFFVTGQIYVDRKATADIRASAQGLIALVTYGLGIGLGSVVSGKVVDYFTSGGVKDWASIWYVPAVFAVVVTAFFWITFKDENEKGEA